MNLLQCLGAPDFWDSKGGSLADSCNPIGRIAVNIFKPLS